MLDLGTLHLKMRAPDDDLKRDLRKGEREVEQSGDRMRRSFLQRALEWLSDIGRRVTDAGATLGRVAGDAAGSGMRIFSGLVDNVGTGIASVASNVWNLIPALLMLAAALAAVGPAALLVGGAIGALPAVVSGALAAVGTLALGFMGIAERFQDADRAGGAFVDRARQVMLAERRLADAQREVLAAQEDLNRAREAAAERIRDLSRTLAGARLDERDAVDAVEEAEDRLRRAREGANPEQIEDAERALERAKLRLDEVRDRVGDLEQEQTDAAEKGVDGSDEVTAALERQRRAAEGVTDATYELQRAHRSAGGAGRQEMTAVAASALAAINVIKSLKGEFESLRLDIQERLFAGSDKEIRSLWSSWLPTLRERLGSMADMFNGLFKTWAATSRNPEFIKNIAAGWESIEDLIDRVGKAILGPGLEAFGKLSKAADPLLDAIGDSLAGIVEDFAEWIDESERSGELQRFFERAGTFFTNIVEMGKDVASIIGSLIDILFQTADEDKQAQSAVGGFAATLDKIAKWLDDPKNQRKVAEWIGKVKDFVTEAGSWLTKAGEWIDKIDGWLDRIDRFGDRISGFKDKASRAWDGFVSAAKGALNKVIDAWNRLDFGINISIPWWLPIPGAGQSFSVPDIFPDVPRLADGALMRARPGGHLVNVAEAGQDEIVSPVDQMRRIVAEEVARIQAERGPTTITIPIQIGEEVERVIEAKIDEHDRVTVRSVRAGVGRR